MAKGKKTGKRMETDAKDRMSPKASYKTMEQIWGVTFGKYKTDNIEDYANTLKQMNLADLQRECVKMGRIPRSKNRNQIIDILLREFRGHIGGLKAAKTQPVQLKASDAAKKVLALGGNRFV